VRRGSGGERGRKEKTVVVTGNGDASRISPYAVGPRTVLRRQRRACGEEEEEKEEEVVVKERQNRLVSHVG